MKNLLWVICIWGTLVTSNVYGHETLDNAGAGANKIGIEEKTGQMIPADLVFYDENGDEVKLGDFYGKPIILTLDYYSCERECPLLLGGLAQALPRLAFQAGRDYRVVTVSFDDTDTPQVARDTKKNYIKAAGSTFPEMGWRFLTGKRQVGFS